MSAFRIGTEAADPASGFDARMSIVANPLSRGQGQSSSVQPAGGARTQFQSAFDKLTKWIPSDTLALYVPGVTVLAAQGARPSVLFLIIMLVATPVFVIVAAFATGKKISKEVVVAALLAAVSFAIWSMSVPLSGWQSWSLIANNQSSAALGAALAGVIFSYIAEGVVKREGAGS